MKIFELLEARSNPQLNKKTITLDALQLLSDQHKGQDLYLSFTGINKLGINPSSKYNTPNGIYAYPLDYVLQRYNRIPFASEAAYAQVFSSSGTLFSITNANINEVKQIRDTVNQMYDLESDDYFLYMYNAYVKKAKGTNVGSIAWYYIYYVAEKLADTSGPVQYNKTGDQVRDPVSLLAAEIWRKLGYSGVVDQGSGTIHSAEPTQAVFFSLVDINHIATLINQIDRTDTVRSNRKAATDPHEFVSTWWNVTNALDSNQILKRLPSDIEQKVFAAPAKDSDVHTMVTYANKFMKGQRLPQNCEEVIARNPKATKNYVMNRRPKVKADLDQMLSIQNQQHT